MQLVHLRIYLTALVWIILQGQVSGFQLQDSTRQYFLAAKFEPGFIFTDDKTLAPLAKSKPWLVQIDFSVLKNRQQAWEDCKCYYRSGASVSYVDFNNSKLGKAVNVITFVEPYFFFSGKMKLSLRGGVGLSYLSKIYDEKTNPDNLFYSSRISFLLMMNLNLYYAVSPAVRIGLSTQFNHISNGGLHWPNHGINFPTTGVGLEYLFNPGSLRRRTSAAWTNRKPKIVAHFFGTERPTDPSPFWPIEKKILMGLNVGWVKPLSRINGFGAGGEFYYDAINKVYQQRSGQEYNTLIGAVSLQHYFFFGRVLFGQQLAYTVTRLNPDVSKRIYERYFLEYRITGRWYGGVSLKAYGDHSEHFALTLGIVL